jgi:hypothetical protein
VGAEVRSPGRTDDPLCEAAELLVLLLGLLRRQLLHRLRALQRRRTSRGTESLSKSGMKWVNAIEVPNLLANPVRSGCTVVQRGKASEPYLVDVVARHPLRHVPARVE